MISIGRAPYPIPFPVKNGEREQTEFAARLQQKECPYTAATTPLRLAAATPRC
jgi:hypothetical protein